MLSHAQYADWLMNEISRASPTTLISMKKLAGNKLALSMNVAGHTHSYRILLFAIGEAGRTNPLERRVEITSTYCGGLQKLAKHVDVILGVERSKHLLVGIDPRRLDHGGPTHNASTFVYLPSFEKLGAGGWFSMQTSSQLFSAEYQVYFVPAFLLEYLRQHQSIHTNGVASSLANVRDELVDQLDRSATSGSKANLNYEQQVELALKKMQIGRVGESLVFEQERRRLAHLGKSSLSKKVKWVSQTQPYLGFDISSYGSKFGEEFIEVKSSVASMQSFYFTANEMSVAQSKGNSYRLVCVSNVMTQPTFTEIRNPILAIRKGLLVVKSGTQLVVIRGSAV